MTNEQMWADAYKDIDQANAATRASNERLMKLLQKTKGHQYRKNLEQLLADCEVGMGMMDSRFQIVRSKQGQWQNERYGKYIRGYWVQQWAVGDSGDSWEGYIYVELKPGRYLKAEYSM